MGAGFLVSENPGTPTGTQGSPPEAEGVEEPGEEEEALSLGAVRLEAVEGGKAQEVLLSPGGAGCNGTGWKLEWL